MTRMQGEYYHFTTVSLGLMAVCMERALAAFRTKYGIEPTLIRVCEDYWPDAVLCQELAPGATIESGPVARGQVWVGGAS